MEENQRKEMDMSYFGEPTARIAKMKEDLLNAQAQVCVERAIYTT